ncbi:cytoplasmic phosphatidylinositol transfer protein 1 isoform X2 [Buteo buteo]|uniref:cytoplasmic phosphatidylinositol transfer protein 1 isoform X2 n=1 Tax=Buteo buteo TaxID=30397 RepID=UPI003EBE500E
MILYSREIEKVPLLQTVESRIKMLNIPLRIIPIPVWNISLNFDLVYSLENSKRKNKPTDIAQNMQDSLETLFLKMVNFLQSISGTSQELNSASFQGKLFLKCSFLPKFSIHIETKYEDNKGSNDSIFDKEAKDLEREVCFIDIASDEIPERYYKESEDPKYFKSQKTGRGQLKEGWRETHQPIMCSYKLVTVKFEVWGLQTRVEQFVHKVVRDILLIGHRQAFAWVDEWYDMTMDDVREYEKNMHEKTNIKVCNQHSSTVDEIESHAKART